MGPFWVAALGVFSGIVFIVMAAAVIIVAINVRHRERLKLHETLKELADKESPVQAELIAALSKSAVPAPARDLQTGVVLVGIGVALAGFGVMVGMPDLEPVWPLIGIAFFPLALGVGRLVLWRVNRDKTPS